MRHRIVITRHRPWLKTGLIAGGAGLIAVAAWGLYSFTRATTISDFERARLEVEQLREERRTLSRDLRAARAEVQELQDQVVYAQRSQDIDSQACTSVRESLTTLQTEVSDLREQLAFYRGIVSPEQSRAGVRVYELRLHPAQAPRRFRFDLVLIQSVRHDRRIGGRLWVEIHGREAGQARSYRLDDPILGGPPNMVFSLKYFEEFSGEFQLPSGFAPQRVTVVLEPAGEGAPRIQDEFEWAKVTSGPAGA